MQTVNQLSAVGCRTLWIDHGPHPDHQHQGDLVEDRRNSGDRPEERSPEFPVSGGKSARPRTTGGDGDRDDDVDVDADWRTRAGEGGSGKRLLNGRSSLMLLDVEEEIGAAGMVGSSEWLLRYVL